MKRCLILVAALVLTLRLGPGSALATLGAPKPDRVAARICAAEKEADKAAFEATYGKRAMRECKRIHRDEATGAVTNASQLCRAEQATDPASFAEIYGTNGNDKNAVGKCVSSKLGPVVDSASNVYRNAAAECRDERAADPAAFAHTYGINGTRRNAFGKCVSLRVKEAEGPSEPLSY